MNKKIRTLTALVSGASLFMAMTPGAHALSLNMDDVVNTMNSLKVQLIWLGIALAAFIVGMIACGKIKSKAKRYLARKQAVVAILAVVAIIINWVCLGPMSTLISLATGNGTVAEETTVEANALCQQIGEEGIVLLDNDGTLPLSAGSKLNVFGWASTNPCYGGTGSGALSDAYPTVSLLDGLTNAGFALNTELSDFYTA